MAKLIFVFIALLRIDSSVYGQGEKILGPGIWSLISISKCPNEDELDEVTVIFEFAKHKLNRTHDGINIKMVNTDDITEDFAIYIDICKHVDGGCKQYQALSDDSIARFMERFSKDNFVAALKLAKIDPPDFPIPAGEHEIEDFVMDYCKLPREAVYGKYDALTYFIYDEKKVACIECILQFNEFEDDNFCDEQSI